MCWLLHARSVSSPRLTALVVAGAMTISFFVQFIVEVRGHSMEPTFLDGQTILRLPRWSLVGRTPVPGDVVIVADPAQTDRLVLKRVVGVSGDHISVRAGEVFVNGLELRDGPTTPCTQVPTPFEECIQWRERVGARRWSAIGAPDSDRYIPSVVVPNDHLFVLGDRRDASRDSRDPEFGLVPVGEVAGFAAEFDL